MFKDFFKKKEDGRDNKRQIENIVVFIISNSINYK